MHLTDIFDRCDFILVFPFHFLLLLITPGEISLCLCHCLSASHTHSQKSQIPLNLRHQMWLISFHKTTPSLSHTHTLLSCIIPVIFLSYDTLEKLSTLGPWDGQPYWKRTPQRAEQRLSWHSSSVCVYVREVGGRIYVCDIESSMVTEGVREMQNRERWIDYVL